MEPIIFMDSGYFLKIVNILRFYQNQLN